MREYKVSIIVPVYKVEQILERCILSLVKQTYRNIEIILINDGSPDSSGEICNYYSKIDSRVQVIHKENGGLSDARNWGIDKASGDYTIFVDSDDYIDENAVKLLLDFAIENELDIVCADAYRIIQSETKKTKERLIGEYTEKNIMTGEDFLIQSIKEKKHSVAVWSRLYKTDLIKANNIYFKKNIYHEDEEWTPRVMLKARRVSYINYPFYYYIIRSNSITQTDNRNKHIKDVIETCEFLNNYFRVNVDSEKNRKILNNYLAKLYINTSTFGVYQEDIYKASIKRRFPLNNAHELSTVIQSIIFLLSPSMYRALKLAYLKKMEV